MPSKPRVVVFSPLPIPSFARQDAELLSSSFEVKAMAVEGFGSGSVGRLRESIRRADAALIWFMGRSALLPVFLCRTIGVPIVAVIGGFEVAWIENLRYGVRPGSLKELVLRRILMACNTIVSVSEFSLLEAKLRFPELRSKFEVIPNAVDTGRFSMPELGPRAGVITVGLVSKESILRKSIHIFRDVATRMPDTRFTLIGKVQDRFGHEFVDGLPPNITWVGWASDEDLVKRLQSASVYFQASVHEAFCVALAEGMSCGCFPVISNYAALPEVAGPTATVLRDLTPESAEIAIRTALERPVSDREAIRNRIVELFGIEKRRELLCLTVQHAIEQSRG